MNAPHAAGITIGDQVYVPSSSEEVGSVIEIHPDHLMVHIENTGPVRIGPKAVREVSAGKVILDVAHLDAYTQTAIKKAHKNEGQDANTGVSKP